MDQVELPVSLVLGAGAVLPFWLRVLVVVLHVVHVGMVWLWKEKKKKLIHKIRTQKKN